MYQEWSVGVEGHMSGLDHQSPEVPLMEQGPGPPAMNSTVSRSHLAGSLVPGT